MNDRPPDPPGGQGGDARGDWIEESTRSDVVLLARAARNGWDVPAAMKRAAVRRMGQIVDEEYLHASPGGDPEVAGPRLAIAAARALAQFDTIDQRERFLDQRIREFDARAEADEASPSDQEADQLREALDLLRRPDPEPQG